MARQIWILRAEIAGNFNITSTESLTGKIPPHPAIKKISITPILNDKNEQTREFVIEIEYTVSNNDENAAPDLPADIGKDIFQSVINILTFLTRYPIFIKTPPSMKYNYPDTKKFRHIIYPVEFGGYPEPPVALTQTDLFTGKIDKKIARIITWLSKGLEEKEIINCIFSLYVSLEILSNQFKCNEKIVRKCNKCGYEMKYDPGMRQKVENLLVNEVGFSPELSKRIWDLRNDLAHGHFQISSNEKKELYSIKGHLILAIIKGTKKLLSLTVDQLPIEYPPRIFLEPYLDTIYDAP